VRDLVSQHILGVQAQILEVGDAHADPRAATRHREPRRAGEIGRQIARDRRRRLLAEDAKTVGIAALRQVAHRHRPGCFQAVGVILNDEMFTLQPLCRRGVGRRRADEEYAGNEE